MSNQTNTTAKRLQSELNAAHGTLAGSFEVCGHLSAIAVAIQTTAKTAENGAAGVNANVTISRMRKLAEAAQYIADDWANVLDARESEGEA